MKLNATCGCPDESYPLLKNVVALSLLTLVLASCGSSDSDPLPTDPSPDMPPVQDGSGAVQNPTDDADNDSVVPAEDGPAQNPEADSSGPEEGGSTQNPDGGGSVPDESGTAQNPGGDDEVPDEDAVSEPEIPASVVSEPAPITPGLVLRPLPNPPLTQAPDAESEPLLATGPVSTVEEFSLVRDPYSTREMIDNSDALTDEDFAQGPLPAVVLTPDSIDPATNAPPYFVDLDDAEVFAGDTLNLRFKPRDPDGDVPGMFIESRPEGSRFIDNFDGSKSLQWTPLQPDAGIHEVTITALDPVEPSYRTVRTVRIKVIIPSDTSNIVNLPPGINKIWDTTARVNDPVVAYIKVTDPNGTIPELEILNPPPGSTIIPHYSEPDFTILKFTPTTAETLEIDLRARDADDPNLTIETSFIIHVRNEDDFQRPGARLRELAATRDLLIGYAAIRNFYEFPDGALYADIAGEEFNFVSTENSLKWDILNPLPGKYRWAAADNLVQLAQSKNQAIHAHTLVWYTQLPKWIKQSPLAERETHMREFIDRVMTRYADDVLVWDVVNESLEDDGTLRNSIWHEAMGPSYIDIAFRQARLSAPNATLLYNDYDVAFAGPKSTAMMNLMQSLKDAGTPIDGVGFQLHLFADFDRFDEVENSFQQIADMDLDVYVTELDVGMRDEQTLEQQADVYEKILSLCLNQPRCKAFQSWGFTDMYSWRRQYKPLLLDESYQIKPAYRALQERLGQN